MPVNILPLADKKLKITGSITIKMTDFKVEPPAPKIALGLIKTGDEVKLIFKWMLAQKKAPAAAAPQDCRASLCSRDAVAARLSSKP